MPDRLSLRRPSHRPRRHDRRPDARWGRAPLDRRVLSGACKPPRRAGTCRLSVSGAALPPVVRSEAMKPAGFDYARCDTVDDALELLCAPRRGGARHCRRTIARWPCSTCACCGPRSWSTSRAHPLTLREGGVRVRSRSARPPRRPRSRLGRELQARLPLVAAALPHIGHFQTRNRGTICGSLCHADPSSELPLCLATLGRRGRAAVACAGSASLKARDFQTRPAVDRQSNPTR